MKCTREDSSSEAQRCVEIRQLRKTIFRRAVALDIDEAEDTSWFGMC
jgi:hypothetical protein